MTLFVAYDQKVEVNGETVLAVVDGLGSYTETAFKWLKMNGIDKPKSGQWYSQQAWLNTFKLITERLGPASMMKIGAAIPNNAQWPPEIDSVEKALASIDVAYHMNHRNGPIGHYSFTKTGPRSGTMVCKNPYPDSFDWGIIEATAKKFKNPDDYVTVTIDESKPVRAKGAESTTYLISW